MNTYTMYTKWAAGLILLLSVTACSSPEPEKEKNIAIAVAVAKPVSVSGSTVSLSGNIEAVQTATISTRIMGTITQMNVKAGDRVRKGQLLFTVSNNDLQAKRAQTDAMITQAEAQLRNAKKDYDRYTVLFKQQSATAKELDNVQLQYEAAKAGAETAMQMRNEVNASFAYTQVRAPFDGIITAKNADAGSMANPGMPVLMLEGAGHFRVAANVPETQVVYMKAGEPATVTLRSINRVITGAIAEINPSSQFNGGQYAVKIDIPRSQYAGLYAGMYANVSVSVKPGTAAESEAGRVLIPVSALVQKDQLTGVYTTGENNKAILRWIRTGKQYGQEVEVLSGLDREEAYIVKADGRLYNGATVVVKQ